MKKNPKKSWKMNGSARKMMMGSSKSAVAGCRSSTWATTRSATSRRKRILRIRLIRKRFQSFMRRVHRSNPPKTVSVQKR